MKKSIYLFIILFSANFLLSNDFSIGSNIGIAFPVGSIKDLYKGLDKSYQNYNDIKIDNTDMKNVIYYNFHISYQLNQLFSLNLLFNNIEHKFNGITVQVSHFENQVETKIQKNPEFKTTNLSLGLDYHFLNYNKLSFVCGIEPQISIINFNSILLQSAELGYSFLENNYNNTALGISGKLGAEYEIINNLKINLMGKYSKVFSIYKYPSEMFGWIGSSSLDNGFSNPQYIFITLGLSYSIF